jgi:threonine synthase
MAVTDEEILDAKAQIGEYGLGCEPASAATIAGLKHLLKNKNKRHEESKNRFFLPKLWHSIFKMARTM